MTCPTHGFFKYCVQCLKPNYFMLGEMCLAILNHLKSNFKLLICMYICDKCKIHCVVV